MMNVMRFVLGLAPMPSGRALRRCGAAGPDL